ncbi:MAG: hypothetical protein EXR98_18065 [Gemmataceae bacterium]|nr:hypothetical protein [Gemmataceae bacterium]
MDFPGAGQGDAMQQINSLLAGLGVLSVILLIHDIILLAALIYYLVSMSAALKQVSPENRSMQPGSVYLALIPCFHFVWLFFVVVRVANSLEKEFRERGLSSDGDCGKRVGILGAILLCLCASPAWLICDIIQIKQVNACMRQLEAAPPSRPSAPDEGYGYDD